MGDVVPGHFGEAFPHICPGPGCAVRAWIKARRLVKDYRWVEAGAYADASDPPLDDTEVKA